MTIKETLRRNRAVREIVRQSRLWRGHANWRPLAEEVRRVGATRSPTSRVLIATVGGGQTVASNIESMLAIALGLRGCRSDVLLCDGAMPACLECNSDWYPDVDRFADHGPTRAHCVGCNRPATTAFRSCHGRS